MHSRAKDHPHTTATTTSNRTLADYETAYRNAAVKAEFARHDRNAAVRRAASDGMTHAAIAAAMGLTRARVGQIALAKPSDLDSV